MSKSCKPKLSIDGQIKHLCSKGVKFDIITKEEALSYLSKNNNYFKLRAYRKSFDKHPDGKDVGKYIELDFAHLKDLAIIDMRLRYLLLKMALDIEHYAKVKLLKHIEDSAEDGYTIIVDFLSSLPEKICDDLKNEIENNSKSPYCCDIINKYKDRGYPVWAFVEIISFGRFTFLYKFCADRLDSRDMLDDYYLMLAVKSLRNATAHNNCILNDLRPDTIEHGTNYGVNKGLSNIGVTKAMRKRKMSNIRIQQIITLFYAHNKMVTSVDIKEHQAKELHDLVSARMFRNIEQYANNDTITTTFSFLKKVVDKWYPIAYNKGT